MKTVHLVPKGEEDMHDLDGDCLCVPMHVEQERLEEVESEIEDADLIYEHNPFGEEPSDGEYAVMEEP